MALRFLIIRGRGRRGYEPPWQGFVDVAGGGDGTEPYAQP